MKQGGEGGGGGSRKKVNERKTVPTDIANEFDL